MTLISARTAAQRILLARLDGQDPAAEKQSRRKRPVGLEVGAVVQPYKLEYRELREIGLETVSIPDRIMLPAWKGRQITGISRADVRDCIETIMQRAAFAKAVRALTVMITRVAVRHAGLKVAGWTARIAGGTQIILQRFSGAWQRFGYLAT
jgi:hypothetical protein